MSESNVTEKDVFDAADQLLAAGERVSNRTVYRQIGAAGINENDLPVACQLAETEKCPFKIVW